MKITIDVDCSPAEAREFFGLPNVKPLQDKWMADMDEKMQQEFMNLSPEVLMRKWMDAASGSPDWLSAFMKMSSATGGGTGGKKS